MIAARGKRLLIIPASILTVITLAIVLATQLGSAEPEPPEPMFPASDEQAAAFEDLFHRYNRIQFDARVNGDSSLFPTIYYNDPGEVLYPEYDDLIREYQDIVDAALENATGGPVGGETGFLSAQIAVLASNTVQRDLWAAAGETASAEGRYPSISDLPEGVAPIEPVTPDQWVTQDIYMHDPVVRGNRGEARFSFGTSRLDGQIVRLTYIQVNGQWYISAIHSEGTP